MGDRLQILNAAFAAVGERPIGAFGEDSAKGRLVRDLWSVAARSALSAAPWGFALERAVLQRAVEPENSLGREALYGLPGDCLRPWTVLVDGRRVAYRRWGARLSVDAPASAEVALDYVRTAPDHEWSADFDEYLALRLGSGIAMGLLRDRALASDLRNAARLHLVEARTRDAQEQTPASFDLSRFTRARRRRRTRELR